MRVCRKGVLYRHPLLHWVGQGPARVAAGSISSGSPRTRAGSVEHSLGLCRADDLLLFSFADGKTKIILKIEVGRGLGVTQPSVAASCLREASCRAPRCAWCHGRSAEQSWRLLSIAMLWAKPGEIPYIVLISSVILSLTLSHLQVFMCLRCS